MKKLILYILFVCLFVYPAIASYTYEVYTYGESKSLTDTESILIDQQGGMYGLTLTVDSSATINGTSTLAEGFGGIWEINLMNDSLLTMSGGQIHEIDVGNNATAVLTGGLIQQIWSYQRATTVIPGEPPQIIPNPHITIVYSGDLPTLQTIYNLPHLVGTWGNGTGFSIYLHDVAGYDPAIENIQFQLIPEPATMLLLGLGGLLIRRKN